ncbi:hypothetical protein GCM10007854_19090 [Algimonas porphyrae]|uniref:Uncharacterized protein n=1 Tax=Algimonas porphyrae TaxID=1128113 RepID=A0ABQ5V2M5_9PROT|nr:hypothetical protein GCM10007854_19090 [Algimonas porphyrae]
MQNFATLSTETGEAETLTRQARRAADNYTARFGVYPPATIIVPGGVISPELQAQLAANGYVTLMPWITARQRAALREATIRSQIEAQLMGQPDAVRQAALSAALAQVGQSGTDARNTSVLAHELGHKWFIHQFHQTDVDLVQHAYGGWAPDWLDEAVAVSLEGVELKSRRREFFRGAMPDAAIALSEFLTMEHPSAAVARALADQSRIVQAEADGPKTHAVNAPGESTGKKGSTGEKESTGKTSRKTSRVITLSGKDAEQFVAASGGDRVLVFYAQALIFGDYLEDRSGRPSILADIASALFTGMDFKLWLATNPYDLPQNLEALQADWDEFADLKQP